MTEIIINYRLNKNDYNPLISIKYDQKSNRYRLDYVGDIGLLSDMESGSNVNVNIGSGNKYYYTAEDFDESELKIPAVNGALLTNLKEALLNMDEKDEQKVDEDLSETIMRMVSNGSIEPDYEAIKDDIAYRILWNAPKNIKSNPKFEELINDLISKADEYSSWMSNGDEAVIYDNLLSLKSVAKSCMHKDTIKEFLNCINDEYAYNMNETAFFYIDDEAYNDLLEGVCENLDSNYAELVEKYGDESTNIVKEFCQENGFLRGD